ncbi:MAG: RHS repeat-associated protein [Flavobacterium sp.]|jgi:RHS repeat-associated protein
MRHVFIFLYCLIFSITAIAQKNTNETAKLPGGGGIEIDPIDEFIYYYDGDLDGHGIETPTHPALVSSSSTPPPYYCLDNYDCDDTNPSIAIYDVTYYFDNDRDGFGDVSITITQKCYLDPPKFYVTNPDDCDDNNSYVNPGASWYFDANSDGIISPTETVVHYGCTPLNENYLSLLYQNFHYTHSISYDIIGQIVNSNRTYFDDLGRSNLSLSKDMMNNKMWAWEVVYDNLGRPLKSSFPTISSYNGFNKVGLISSSTYSPPTHNSTLLYNGYYPTTQDLQDYYSDNNTLNEYQAIAAYPYEEVEYDKLNPGNVISQYGGNQIAGEWKTGYSFTVPAAQEMYYVFGHNYYNGLVDGNQEEVITKFYKTVNIDPHGIETVVFSDGEGKTLAAARSANSTVSYPVISTIGTQGFVDVYIPAGTSAGVLIGVSSNYKVYDLKTGALTTSGLLPGNAYRVEATIIPTRDYKTYINVSTGGIEVETGALGVSHNVNYYDYTLNYYDKTDRLYKTIQPTGFNSASTINTGLVAANPIHTMNTDYEYSTLGQLIKTTSPDEGISTFAYRNDGALRFSQNAIQAANNQVSYINYDTNGRVIESGILSGLNWATALLSVDDTAFPVGTTKSEENFIVYDYDGNYQGITPPVNDFNSFGLNPVSYNRNNLAGNVVTAYTNETSSWYSYDIYGRIEWMVQNIVGFGLKTIHYNYDAHGNVKKVIYQQDSSTDKFEHLYSYNFNNQLIKVETAFNNGSFTTNAEYEYYIDGSLKRTNIANGLQGLDYVYTLDGKLKSINHPSLSAAMDPGGDTNDVFGLILDYHDEDYKRTSHPEIATSPSVSGANTNYYNGNIKAIRYANKMLDENSGTVTPKAFVYDYNDNNWLRNAKYGSLPSNGLGAITLSPTNSYAEGNLNYDANGNISTLTRRDATGTATDNLSYTYYAGKNQLNSVADSGPVTPSDASDLESQSLNNYGYNAIGQMVSNAEEDLTYEYNAQGLVTVVRKAGIPLVRFFYNERGERYKKTSYYTGGVEPSEYYVNDVSGTNMAIYRQQNAGAISIKEIPVYGGERLGVYTVGPTSLSSFYQYEIADHLGNVRAVLKQPASGTIPSMTSYADYYPFGELLPGRNVLSDYRYAFQGQEKDSETGMEAFKLRLWDGRIGRWLSPDPYGQYYSPYLGMGNNPISLIDADGGWVTGPVLFGLKGAFSALKNALGYKLMNFLGVSNEQMEAANKNYSETGNKTDLSSQILYNVGVGIPNSYNQGVNDRISSIGNFWLNEVSSSDYWGSKLNSFGSDFMNPNSIYHNPGEHMINGLSSLSSMNAMELSYTAGYSTPELAIALMPVPKFSVNISINNSLRKRVLSFDLKPRITNPYFDSKGLATRGYGFGQYDAGHRASTFMREKIIMEGKFGIKDYKSIYFNYTNQGQNFSIGANPWTRTIYHEGPGIFK